MLPRQERTDRVEQGQYEVSKLSSEELFRVGSGDSCTATATLEVPGLRVQNKRNRAGQRDS